MELMSRVVSYFRTINTEPKCHNSYTTKKELSQLLLNHNNNMCKQKS